MSTFAWAGAPPASPPGHVGREAAGRLALPAAHSATDAAASHAGEMVFPEICRPESNDEGRRYWSSHTTCEISFKLEINSSHFYQYGSILQPGNIPRRQVIAPKKTFFILKLPS